VNGSATSLSGACGVDDEAGDPGLRTVRGRGRQKGAVEKSVMRKGDAALAFTVPLSG